MAEEKKEGQEGQESGQEEKKETPQGSEEKKTSIPGFDEVGKEVGELRGRLTESEKKLKEASEELKRIGPTTEVVRKLQEVLSGKQVKKSETDEQFYQLLVQDPKAAIRMVAEALREEDKKERLQERIEKEWETFSKAFPEYKEIEEDMKQVLMEDPSLFGKKNFLEKVFFDIMLEKKPDDVQKFIDRRKRLRSMGDLPQFIFEGASQTEHGGPETTGKEIMDRLKSAAPTKSYFD